MQMVNDIIEHAVDMSISDDLTPENWNYKELNELCDHLRLRLLDRAAPGVDLGPRHYPALTVPRSSRRRSGVG